MIESLQVKDTDTALTREIKQTISADLEKWYPSPDLKVFLLLAAFLNPRFKRLPQVHEEAKTKIYENLETKAVYALNTVKVIV